MCDTINKREDDLVNDCCDNQPLWLGGGALHHAHTLNDVG